MNNISFVLGNGTSRQGIDLNKLKELGYVYGCNALYREFSPHYLVAVDLKMILEIAKSRYQYTNEFWTNPRHQAVDNYKNIKKFDKGKGWSSGPTALDMATWKHKVDEIYILGFDYTGHADGSINNLYAGSKNYKDKGAKATFYGNWLRQTTTVINENPNIMFKRVIASDNQTPQELNNLNNLEHMTKEKFKEIFNV